MTDNTRFYIPAQTQEFEETIKKSRFITYLLAVANAEEAKSAIQSIKQQHSDARHHCSAFVAGLPSDSRCYGFSDDGEPSGTAGKPMLAVLQGSGLGHILAVVVRYSGGIKLGTGGLVKAYGGGVKQALALLETELKVIKQHYRLKCSYAQWDQLSFWLTQYDGDVVSIDYAQNVELLLALSEGNSDKFAEKLSDQQLELKGVKPAP